MRRVRILSISGEGALGKCRMDGRHEHVVVDLATGRVLSDHRDYWSARRSLAKLGFEPEEPEGLCGSSNAC